ncbi:MAG: NAD(P)-dependent oxidoreductase [Beutenbergiaceae bacterium]
MNIGFIGVGAIGYPMAERLLPHFEVTVFDVDSARVAELAAQGATTAGSAADAAGGADVVIVMVATPAQLNAVLFESTGAAVSMTPGSTMLIMSSVGIDSARSAADSLRGQGVRVVDAPVTGGVVRAIAGELTILLGGDATDIDRVRPVLAHLGSKLAICGARVGDGQAVKLVNQHLCSIHLAAAGEALALAGALGLYPAAVLDTVGSGAAASFMLNDRGPRMLQEDPPVLSAIDIFVKDAHLVQDAALAAGALTPILDAAADRFDVARAAGLGRVDDSAVYRTYTPLIAGS